MKKTADGYLLENDWLLYYTLHKRKAKGSLFFNLPLLSRFYISYSMFSLSIIKRNHNGASPFTDISHGLELHKSKLNA
jgi:hypothetical protein